MKKISRVWKKELNIPVDKLQLRESRGFRAKEGEVINKSLRVSRPSVEIENCKFQSLT